MIFLLKELKLQFDSHNLSPWLENKENSLHQQRTDLPGLVTSSLSLSELGTCLYMSYYRLKLIFQGTNFNLGLARLLTVRLFSPFVLLEPPSKWKSVSLSIFTRGVRFTFTSAFPNVLLQNQLYSRFRSFPSFLLEWNHS